jgi:hypothetical protein
VYVRGSFAPNVPLSVEVKSIAGVRQAGALGLRTPFPWASETSSHGHRGDDTQCSPLLSAVCRGLKVSSPEKALASRSFGEEVFLCKSLEKVWSRAVIAD